MIQEILEHAKRQYPLESCGLVLEDGTYIPCNNMHPTPNTNFKIDPLDFANAEDIGEIVKVVHSHVDVPPTPSQADLVNIENSGIPWIIVNAKTETHTETMPTGYAAPLVGRVFTAGVLDCFTIIQDYHVRELNIPFADIERQDKWWEYGENLYLDNYEEWGFSPVKELKKNDVILMTLGSSTVNHAAMYLGDGHIMHHVQGRLSSIDVYGGYWAKNTYAFMRHKDVL